jgi:hypothetical protein
MHWAFLFDRLKSVPNGYSAIRVFGTEVVAGESGENIEIKASLD